MFEVTKYVDFCYGHRLLNYQGKCRHLHGHNGRVEFQCRGETLDERGMLTDFGDIKRIMKTWIDDHIDHCMLLHRDDPALEYVRDTLGEPVYIMDENPTAETLARLLYRIAREQGLPIAQVTFWETPTSYAVYKD